MPLHQRRTLVRELLSVSINPGRKPERVRIDHIKAPSLNAEGDFGG